MKIKVSIEELIDNDCLKQYAENRGQKYEYFGLEKDEEVYITETEAENWGFIGKTRNLFGGDDDT